MADNDLFSVLARVELDVGALRASLGAAEQAVIASTQRQKKTYADFANDVVKKQEEMNERMALARAGSSGSGLYAAKYGTGAGGKGGPGGAAADAAEGIGRMTEATGRGMGNLRNFQHLINMLAPGMGGLAINVLQVAKHMGVFAAAGLAAILVFQHIREEMARVSEETRQINKAAERGNIDALVSKMDELGDAMEKDAGVADTLVHALGGVTVNASLQAQAAIKLRDAWNDVVNVMIREAEIDKILQANQVQRANRMRAEASSKKEILDATKNLGKATEDELEQNKRAEKLALIAEQRKKGMMNTDEGIRQSLRELAEVDKKYAAQKEANADRQAEREVDDSRKIAGLRAARIDSEIKRMGLEQKSAQAVIESSKAELEAKRSLEAADAAFNGRAIRGMNEYIAAKAATAMREIDLEKLATDETINLRRERLKGLIAEGGPNVEQYRQELDELQKEELEVDKQTAEKKKQLAMKTAQEQIEEKRRAVQEQIRLADEVFNHEASLGKKSLGEQIEQARSAVGDSRRSAADRQQQEVRAFQLYKQEGEAYFALRRAYGENTLQDEIKYQEQLNSLYKQGSAEWYQGMAKVAGLQKQMRDEARSTFTSMAGRAAESLKARGRTAVSSKDIQDEITKLERGDEATLREFGRGGKVDFSKLSAAVNAQEGFERFNKRGGDIRNEFDLATTNRIGQIPTLAGNPMEKYSEPFKAAGDTMGTAAKEFADAVDAFAEAQKGGRSSGSPDLVQAQLSSTIGRTGALEARRGPAPQLGLS